MRCRELGGGQENENEEEEEEEAEKSEEGDPWAARGCAARPLFGGAPNSGARRIRGPSGDPRRRGLSGAKRKREAEKSEEEREGGGERS